MLLDEPELKFTSFLISHGVNINQKDCNGKTSLDVTIELKPFKAEKLLRSLGGKTSVELDRGKKL